MNPACPFQAYEQAVQAPSDPHCCSGGVQRKGAWGQMRGCPNDEEDPVSSHTRAPHHCLSLGHHTDTDTSCVHLISAIQNQGPQGGLFFLHPGDGMIRGRVSSSVGRGLIKGNKSVLFHH